MNCRRVSIPFIKKKKKPHLTTVTTAAADGNEAPVCLCARSRVRRSDAEAPVYVWGQQPPPRARRKSSEHLVQAAGARAQGSVRGMETPSAAMQLVNHHLAFISRRASPCARSASAAGRPPWRSCSPSIRRSTCSCLAPAPSTASNWTTASWPVITTGGQRFTCEGWQWERTLASN